MKRFKIEHNDYEKPAVYVTLHKPPYEDENVLYKLGGYKVEDVTITDVTPTFEEEE
jgi:hypothetical protein